MAAILAQIQQVCFHVSRTIGWASQVVQWQGIYLPTQEMRVRSLGREDPLEEKMATCSRIPAWEIPWTEKTGRSQSMELQRVGHG